MIQNSKKIVAAIVLAGTLLLTLGFASGWFIHAHWSRAAGPPFIREQRLSGYKFINPLLECESGSSDAADRELQPFRHKIQAVIEAKKKAKWASHVSVYFREMNNGLAFDLDGQEKFSPASLVKIPLLIAYFKWEEMEPGLLGKRLTYINFPDNNAAQNIKPAVAIEYGKSYLIEDLLFRAMVYSDNNAYFLLFANVNPGVLRRVYTDLGLEISRVRTVADYVTVSEYAAFFRILFNASYLNRELSEKALSYMAETDFKMGLVSGVPSSIPVAHKFGEKTLGPSGEIKQLHDCGIVYYPEYPYLLCVMSRGESFEFLDDTIREVSRVVFEEIDRQRR